MSSKKTRTKASSSPSPSASSVKKDKKTKDDPLLLNENQERLQELIKRKKECDKRALDIVLKLIEPDPEVTGDYLLQNAIYIGPPHFEDVVEERRIGGICGWVLCPNPLTPEGLQGKKQQYVIRANKVLDITNRKAFCSSKCYARSTHFKKQLLVSPLWLREEEVEKDKPLFEILEDDTELHGLTVSLTGVKLDDSDSDSDKDKDEHDQDKDS